MLNCSILLGQSYIEVKGEPDLSVYLNSKFKGKITDEAGIFIIENVTPGKNLIKIVKEGYTPFEETIIVKANEVLAYKVKPFTKHKVYVSQEGNTAETDKKAIIKTGKLIVQSVPIEIKITIPDIDGINKSAKTKDKWLADEIPAGTYDITFTYNQKVISKTIEIKGSETTSLFVNMLSGDFKASNTLDERKTKENALLKKGEEEFTNYYPFKYEIGLSVEETKRKYPELKLKKNKDSDDLISSDEQYKFFVKNDRIYGIKGIIVSNINIKNDYHIYSEMFKKGNETKNDLYAKFKFNPLVKQSDDFNYRSKSGSFNYSDIPIDEILYNGHLWCKDGDKVSYKWQKNDKIIQLDITVVQKNKLLTLLMGYTIAITIIKE
jgi:hypothetical protein